VGLTGCKGSNIVKVNGVLTYKGTPVKNARLQFLPENGRQSWAETDEQGRFKVNYDAQQDGAVIGKHKVWIEPRPMTVAEKTAIQEGRELPMSNELREFFDKYGADKTPLVAVEITREHASKELRLDLD
jgi:hypothetical protein